MTASGAFAPVPDGADLASAEDLLDFTQIDPDAPSGGVPVSLASFASPEDERIERVNATIVTVLTVVCTFLSIFDLFLLASGS
jgi:hypothetical protein